jgi:hypothetical protein
MLGVVGLVPNLTGSMCVFQGGSCVRQLGFLQFLLPAVSRR